MSIAIHLDSATLAALFPEGSTARADLQRGVIANFINHHMKPGTFGKEISAQIEAARKSVVVDALEKLGITKRAYSTDWRIADSIIAEIREHCQASVRAAIRDQVKEHLDERIEHVKATITHDCQAAVNRLVDAEINAAVKARVAGVVAKLGA
jgi:hypothetical protein